jgi:hypothetical protein
MKKIDIIEDLENLEETTQAEDQTPVDENLLLNHNQDSLNQSNIQENTIGKDSSMKSSSKLFILITVFAVLAGVGTGFGSFKLFAKPSSGGPRSTDIQELPTAGKVKVGDVFGSTDASFKDSAEGYLEDGGLDGEGSHKLLRPGGESQTVYLTSSVTDLSELAGVEVKVWGETFKGQKAGWLMDVGRVEVLDIDAESPAEE